MSREIKFRAWDKKNKRMFPVTTLHFDDTNFRVLTIQEHNHYSHHVFFHLDENQAVLMQFIGLHDKNTTEVYEEDILLENSAGDLWTWIVKWNEDGYYYILHEPSGEKLVMDDMLEVVKNSEVIGNLFENPSLLAGDNP